MTSRLSLYRFLLTRILWVVVPILVAGMGVHWYFERRLLEKQFDESLAEKAMTLATLVTQKGEKVELEFADEFMPQYSRDVQPYFFQIWRADGRPLERSYSLHGADLPYRRGTLEAPAVFETKLPSGLELRCVGIEFPARLESEEADLSPTSVVIAIAAEAEQLNAKLRAGWVEVALTGLLSVAGVSIVVALALGRGVQLFRRIVREVEQITPGTLDTPLDEARAPEEIRPIVAALNGSLQTIRGFVERERRFTADVAHELRTPIAELRASADVALKWPDEEARDRLAHDARAIALQMGSLVESLLELATLESQQALGPSEDVNVVKIVGQAVEHASRGVESSARAIRIDAPGTLHIQSHPLLWEIAVRNLLDNALAYSPVDGEITVVVRADGDGARLAVSNPTELLDEESVRRCTERLWRAARDRDGDRHFGLGLSIVQAACEKLGHRFDVQLERGVFHATISRNVVAAEA